MTTVPKIVDDIARGKEGNNPNSIFSDFRKRCIQFKDVQKPVLKHVPKSSFDNAIRFTIDNPKTVYCEGWIIHKQSRIPSHHAWNKVHGICVDLSVENPNDYDYYGIELTKLEVMCMITHSCYQPFFSILENVDRIMN